MRITVKGLASLNYNSIFKILCMPKIIPFACWISLPCYLCVLNVHTSLPESWDAPDDLVYVLWFVQSESVWSPGSNQIKGRKVKILCYVEGLTFFLHCEQVKRQYDKEWLLLKPQGSTTVIEVCTSLSHSGHAGRFTRLVSNYQSCLSEINKYASSLEYSYSSNLALW